MADGRTMVDGGPAGLVYHLRVRVASGLTRRGLVQELPCCGCHAWPSHRYEHGPHPGRL